MPLRDYILQFKLWFSVKKVLIFLHRKSKTFIKSGPVFAIVCNVLDFLWREETEIYVRGTLRDKTGKTMVLL